MKMRKTFVNIGLAITKKRQHEKKQIEKKARRTRFSQITVVAAGATFVMCIGFYMFKDMIIKKTPPLDRTAPRWNELSTDSKEYANTSFLIDKMSNALKLEEPDGLNNMWSSYIAPERIADYWQTLQLYSGGNLKIQTVRKKADASKKFIVICKSSKNKHRLKIALRMEDGFFKLSSADMIP